MTMVQCLKSGDEKEKISAADATRILIMVCNALQYLHNKDIIHNDLKADNIVPEKRTDELSPVIVDFGKVCMLANGKIHCVSKTHQEEYMRRHGHIAPEIVKGQRRVRII